MNGANAAASGRTHPPPPPHVPLAAAPFVHRGEFVGTYYDLATAGAKLAGSFAGKSAAAVNMRDAHLRGTLWTLVDNGMVHVFRCLGRSNEDVRS